MLRRMRRMVAGRPSFLAALLVLIAVGVGLIVAALVSPAGAWRDLLINLAATAIGVVLTAVVLEPLIEIARRPEERILDSFPHQEFIAEVTAARRMVKVMGAWPYVMDAPWRDQFLDAVRAALRGGAEVHILLLDPLSPAAAQRQSDLGSAVDVSAIITDSLTSLSGLANSLDGDARGRFAVRVYSVMPPARLYLADQKALCSFFPMGNHRGGGVPHYETTALSGLSRFVEEQFDVLWRHPSARPLDEYWYLTVFSASRSREFSVQYVETDGALYLASRRLVEVLFRVTGSREEIRLTVDRTDHRGRYAIETALDGATEVSRVRTAFAQKYGSRSELRDGFSAVIKLVEAPEQETGGMPVPR